MKTLLFTGEFPPFKGGVANYYGNLVNYWPPRENLSVLDNNRGELWRSSSEGWRPGPPWLRSFGALRRKLRMSRSDYVLVGEILPYGTVAFILSFFLPFRYGVFLHGLDLTMALSALRKRSLASLILRRADKIICANSYVAQRVQAVFPAFTGPGKVAVVNPGIATEAPYVSAEALDDMRSAYNLAGKTVLLTIGRLVKRKGVDQAIRALSEIPPLLCDTLVYCVAGAGPDEAYLKSLVPDSLKGQIIFLGELNEQEKWRWLHLCDIFVMPARNIQGDYEGFGIVYLEANLCGKPVIAGRSGGVGDAVIDGLNGLLVDPESIAAIAAAVSALSVDPALRDRLGKQGRQRAITEFNWEGQVAKLFDFLKN